MHMKMRNSLSRIGAVVDHQSEAGLEDAELFCDCPRSQQQQTEKVAVTGMCLPDVWHPLLRYDQNMHRGLRMHVLKSDQVFVFINNVRWNLTVDDFIENSHQGRGFEMQLVCPAFQCVSLHGIIMEIARVEVGETMRTPV